MFQKAQNVRRHFKVAISGGWKVGKTRGALSFPKPAVIDTHRGTDLYDDKYDFQVLHAQTWKEMDAPIKFLVQNAKKEGIETLVIDDVSTIYDDLIGEVSAWRANKSGSNAPLSQGDWGVIKRRWKAFLQMLLRLDLNVVLVIREKEEYEESTNSQGQEIRRKTGGHIMDVDRQTSYLFDFILRFHTEDNKKQQTSKHVVTIEGTRHHALPKYSTYDITGKRLYEALFEKIRGDVEKGIAVSQEPLVVPDKDEPAADAALATEPGAQEDPIGPASTSQDNIKALNDFFGVAPIDPNSPEATLEDIKVLMTKANAMQWPDDAHKCRAQGCKANGHIHPNFKTADGKSLIKGAYGVESTRELRKPQIEFLHNEFGKVLAGKAFLARDPEGSVYVATPVDAGNQEVNRKAS